MVGAQLKSYEEVITPFKNFETENIVQVNCVLQKKSAKSVKKKCKNRVETNNKDFISYYV